MYLSVIDQALLNFVGCMPATCILVDESGQIVASNAAANKLLAKQDGLHAERGTLEANGSTADLRKLIVEASRGGTGPCATAIHRNSGRPLLLRACRLQNELGMRPATVLLLVTDLDERPRPDIQVLKRLFGFTRMEACLAVCLMSGDTLEESSAKLKISIYTARTHLKRIFAKTNVTRQAELIDTLLRAPTYSDPQPVFRGVTLEITPKVSAAANG